MRRISIAIAATLLTGALWTLAAQTPTPAATAPPAFEVASIKRGDPAARGFSISGPMPSQFTVRTAPLYRIIMYAYGIREDQIIGGPNWMRSDTFDIIGKYPQEWTPPQLPQMVQALLVDRFKLKMHNETREGSTYALVLARSDGRLGPKLRKTDIDCAAFMAERKAQGLGPLIASAGMTTCMGVSSNQFVHFSVRTIGVLASVLASRVGRPVVDRTGLEGNYDIELDWTPDPPAAATPGAVPTAPTPDDSVPLFTALQEQLGLKLQSERGPVQVWVIDSVEPPTPD